MSRRRVPKFGAKAQALLDAVDWPEGVTVVVDPSGLRDMIYVGGLGAGRAMWSLDPYDLASADPEKVRATAIRRLESTGTDPRYTEKSRREDLALADLLRGETRPVCPNGHGLMVKRANPTAVAAEQGTWWDCAPGPVGGTCYSSVLYPRAEP